MIVHIKELYIHVEFNCKKIKKSHERVKKATLKNHSTATYSLQFKKKIELKRPPHRNSSWEEYYII